MEPSELGSFISKFKQLWKSGLDVKLNIEANAGQAWASLHVRLGQAPGPPFQDLIQPPPKKPRNGPSRQRRRERRAAERLHGKAEEDSLHNQESDKGKTSEEEDLSAEEAVRDENELDLVATDNEVILNNVEETLQNVSMNIIDSAEHAVVNEDELTLETVASVKETLHSCEKCEFIGKTEGGLKTHMTVKHKKVSLRGYTRITS